MNDIKLLRIALVIGIAGIICLFFLTKIIEAQEISIGQITEEMIGKKVLVQGIVETVEEKKSVLLISIKEQETQERISVAFFSKDYYIPEKGEIIAVTGTVKEYYGSLEIVGERIDNVT